MFTQPLRHRHPTIAEALGSGRLQEVCVFATPGLEGTGAFKELVGSLPVPTKLLGHSQHPAAADLVNRMRLARSEVSAAMLPSIHLLPACVAPAAAAAPSAAAAAADAGPQPLQAAVLTPAAAAPEVMAALFGPAAVGSPPSAIGAVTALQGVEVAGSGGSDDDVAAAEAGVGMSAADPAPAEQAAPAAAGVVAAAAAGLLAAPTADAPMHQHAVITTDDVPGLLDRAGQPVQRVRSLVMRRWSGSQQLLAQHLHGGWDARQSQQRVRRIQQLCPQWRQPVPYAPADPLSAEAQLDAEMQSELRQHTEACGDAAVLVVGGGTAAASPINNSSCYFWRVPAAPASSAGPRLSLSAAAAAAAGGSSPSPSTTTAAAADGRSRSTGSATAAAAGSSSSSSRLGGDDVLQLELQPISASFFANLGTDTTMLVDVGERAADILVYLLGAACGPALRRLRLIAITHPLWDHFAGLGEVLLLWRQAVEDGPSEEEAAGEEEAAAAASGAAAAAGSSSSSAHTLVLAADEAVITWLEGRGLECPELHTALQFVQRVPLQACSTHNSPAILSGVLSDMGFTAWQFVLLRHGIRNALGLCLDHAAGWRCTHSGDTAPSPELIAAAYNTTLLIHEASRDGPPELPNHSTAPQAMEVAAQMRAHRSLLGHRGLHTKPHPPPLPTAQTPHSQRAMVAISGVCIRLRHLCEITDYIPNCAAVVAPLGDDPRFKVP